MLNYVDSSITTVDGNFTVSDDPIDVTDGSEWPSGNFTVKVWDGSDASVLKAVILVGTRTSNSLSSLTWNYGGHTDVNIADGDYIALTSTKYDYELKNYLHYWAARQPGETAHADDEFFNGTSPTGTAVDPTGTTVWTESAGVLGCLFDDQAANDQSAMLWPMTPNTTPVTIEAGISSFATRLVASPMFGVIYTDGTTTTSNAVSFGLYQSNNAAPILARFAGTLTNMTVTNLFTQMSYVLSQEVRLRLAWTAANTWDWGLSGKAGPFTDFGGSGFSATLSPTHYGVFVSAWGSGIPHSIAFDYFRVALADLSP